MAKKKDWMKDVTKAITETAKTVADTSKKVTNTAKKATEKKTSQSSAVKNSAKQVGKIASSVLQKTKRNGASGDYKRNNPVDFMKADAMRRKNAREIEKNEITKGLRNLSEKTGFTGKKRTLSDAVKDVAGIASKVTKPYADELLYRERIKEYKDSPYLDMSYKEITDQFNNSWIDKLYKGDIDEFTFYRERAANDVERLHKTSNLDEVDGFIGEKENEIKYWGKVLDSRTNEVAPDGTSYTDYARKRIKELAEIVNKAETKKAELINNFATEQELEKIGKDAKKRTEDRERLLVEYGKKALNSGAEPFSPEWGYDSYGDKYLKNLNTDFIGPGAEGANEKTKIKFLVEMAEQRKQGNYNAEDHRSNLHFINDTELTTVLTLLNYDVSEALKYMDKLEESYKYETNQFKAQVIEEKAAEFAKAHPIAGGVVGTLGRIATPIAATGDNLIDLAFTGKIDAHDDSSLMLRGSNTLHNNVHSYIKENYGSVWADIYSIGTEGIKMAAQVAAGPGVGSAMMFNDAMANTTMNIADRGGSTAQMILGGIASGLIEMYTEKVTFGKYWDAKAAKSFLGVIKEGLKNAPNEVMEELLADAGNAFFDTVLMGDKSEAETRVREYIANGMSYNEAAKKVLNEDLMNTLETIKVSGALGAIFGGGTSGIAAYNNKNYMSHVGNQMMESNPDAFRRVIEVGIQNNNAEAIRAAENIMDGARIDSKTAGKILTSVIEQSVESDGGMMNIMKMVGVVDGRGPSYIGSPESIDTAKAVMNFVQGKATDVDKSLISRSRGATTLLTAIEGNKKAWDNIDKAAGRDLRPVGNSSATLGMMGTTSSTASGPPSRQWEGLDSGVRYKNEENVIVSKGDVYTEDGKKVAISDKSDIVNGIVVNGEGRRFKEADPKGYSVGEKLATALKKPVTFVKGLYDAEGKMLDGVETDSGIFINTEAKNPIKWAATHEFSHTMKKSAAEAWAKYQNFVVDKMKKDGNYYEVFEAKAKAYGTRDVEYINEEIAADHIGETFDSVDELADFISKDRGLAVKVRDIYYKVLDKLGLVDEKKKAQLMWRDAYRKAVLNVAKKTENQTRKSVDERKSVSYGKTHGEAGSLSLETENPNALTAKDGKVESKPEIKKSASGTRKSQIYDYSKSFAEQIDDFIDGKIPNNDTLVVGKTEKVYLDIGFNALPVTIAQGHVKTALDKNSDADHYLGETGLKQIPDALKNPIAIIRSTTHLDRVVSLIPITLNGKTVIAPFEIDGSGRTNNIRIDSNAVVSVYGKGNAIKQLSNALYGETSGSIEMFYWNKKEAIPLLQRAGLQLPGGLPQDGFIHSIRENGANINTKFKNVTETQQFKRWFGKSKVVNADGTPKVVYHGTNAEFWSFDLNNSGKNYPGTSDGFFFFTNKKNLYPNSAEDYARDSVKKNGGKEKIMEVYLSIKRPLKLDSKGYYDTVSYFDQNSESIYDKYLNGNYDGVIIENSDKSSDDGILYLVDNSTQIKSATDNIGTFDGSNPDIRYSISGTRASEIEDSTEETSQKFIKPGAEPRRDVKVPESVEEDTKVRQFARTAAEAKTLTNKTAEGVLENVEKGKFNYTPISNKSAMNNAYATLEAMGPEWVENKVNGAISSHNLDKNTVAMAEVLLEKYSAEDQEDKAQKLIINFAAESTRLAQSLQAISMLKKLDKDYELAYIDKIIENLKEDIVARNNKKLGKKNSLDINVSEELKTKLKEATTEEEREAIREEIYTEIANQLPSSWVDQWNAWRYFAMLGNPRTHIRNILGNLFFMPAIATKNIAAKFVEPIVGMISGGKMERSKTFIVPKKYRKFAKDDALAMKKTLQGGGKHNPTSAIKDKQTIFKFKPLEWTRIKVGDALEAEDWLFLKHHYKVALRNYLAANKIDLDNMNEKILDRARNAAIKEAQRNTYRDASAVANALSKFSQKNKVTAVITESLMPFKKTPINVLKRGFEYSPAGLVIALSYNSYKLAKGDITASEYIDRLCGGLTGTGIILMGMWLRSTGVISGSSEDDKEKEFDALTGVQNYSISIGDHNYTLDWIAPMSLPFFVGVEIQNIVENGDGIEFRNIVETLSNMSEPFFEMSMLQGLTGTVDVIKQAGSAETASKIGWKIGTNYINQAVPTLFGQIARTVDGTQRKSYDDKNANMPSDLQYFLQGLMKKIPGVSKKLEPYVDEWGREKVTENPWVRGLNNMLSPGYYSKINVSEMEQELKRLYQEVGDEENMKIFPTAATKDFKVNKEDKKLTAEEYTQMQKAQGQTAYNLLTSIIADEIYAELDDYTRGKIVGKVYEVASAYAKSSVTNGAWTTDTKWITDAVELLQAGNTEEAEKVIVESGIENAKENKKTSNIYETKLSNEMTSEEYEYVRDYAKNTAALADGKDSMTKDELVNYLNSTDYSENVKAALFTSIAPSNWYNPYTGKKNSTEYETIAKEIYGDYSSSSSSSSGSGSGSSGGSSGGSKSFSSKSSSGSSKSSSSSGKSSAPIKKSVPKTNSNIKRSVGTTRSGGSGATSRTKR